MPAVSRFVLACSEWLRSDLDRFDRLWLPPKFDATTVRLPLRRFAPHLHVHLDRHNANVAVEWESEGWDFLYADDVSPERTESGWRCGSCPHPADEYPTLEQLWTAHLFMPVTDWIERVLLPAEILYLHEYRHCTWVSLADRGSIPPEEARYTIYASAQEDG